MEAVFATKEDLNRLLNWCNDAPDYQKYLSSYIKDRDDTAVVILKDEHELAAIGLLKIMTTEKTGSIWIYTKEANYQNHPEMIQTSLKWLRQKGAKNYTVI
ncbi:hypothetical protein AWM68_19180 [Fictibacillus phosphorivorans]|uniref:N-acetyltransferase domain-containing protein n=1 Tax=Fictibacillus phosphorivorans TaxID=1221500 RepID=A0A163RU91_9BACL|nr:hypothetical protein [Fictibacillus phosphorivorans]KZE67587.1 hypothetical protein AWM68_19180 [Fictibacillus phosphorivorans]